MKTNLSCLFVVLSLFFSCEEETDNSDENVMIDPTNCDFTTIVDANDYASAIESDELSIHSMQIEDECLSITYSAGGCDGESWETRLIDSGEILESFPIQRNLIFELVDNEACEAFITKTTSFDISELKEGYDEVILNITNVDKSISTNPDNTNSNCDSTVIIDADMYESAESDGFSINSIEMVDDCLEINFGASGCAIESKDVKLIDSGLIIESEPKQRNLFFDFTTNGDCLTYLTETISFDISALKEANEEVLLNITNFDKQILITDTGYEVYCDFIKTVEPEEFSVLESDDFTIHATEVVGNCLEITFSASGCDGKSWETKLIASNTVLDVIPTVVSSFFELTNNELCEAVITKTVSFDISNFEVGVDKPSLFITNAGKNITF